MRDVEGEVGKSAVGGLAFGEGGGDLVEEGVGAGEGGALVTVGGVGVEAVGQGLSVGVEVNAQGVGCSGDGLSGDGLHGGAAAEGDDMVGLLGELLHDLDFHGAVGGLAVGVPDLGNGAVVEAGADGVIDVGEGEVESVGEESAEGGLAGGAVAEEDEEHGAVG